MKADESEFGRNDRKETDDSLSAEREKATESLKAASVSSQDQTDVIVKDERAIADKKTASSRAHHDESRRELSDPSPKKVELSQLNEERRRSDLATDVERSKIDAAILKERSISKDTVINVLEDERKITDQNLLIERDTADVAHGKTQRSLTTRDEFLAIVSHDLINPIGAVRSYAEILLEDSNASQMSAEVVGYVEAILRNADASLRLITDLLDVERFAQGKFELNAVSGSADTLIRDTLANFRHLAEKKHIRLTASSTQKETEIHCDRDRITQVLGNLVANALKFTPENGEVELSVNRLGSDIEFSIKDSGIGIPENKKHEIFNRFAQIGNKHRTGLGLGLYISRALAEAHGGRLTVDSEPAKGSRFRLSLPAVSVSER